jgi:glycosyltransferase involved in cell wall biosynthesis
VTERVAGDDTVLVLATDEKNGWWSLAEILPAVEDVWAAIGRSGRENVRVLRVPLAPEVERSVDASASRVRTIVLTVVTPGTVEVALRLRRRLDAAAPMIVYMYGDATEGLVAFGDLANALTERDRFVVSSEADGAATRCCYPDAQVTVIPFPLVDRFGLDRGERETGPGAPRLVYVGRVSEQKNLHTLLLALWVRRVSHGRTPGLDVYGGVDGLGSPNMGLTFPDYGTYLRDLAERLGLADTVTWHGFTPRGRLLDDVHPSPHVFVTPSLHSDENFGTSVLASLVNGRQVVATAWGGHIGFRDWFPGQLTLVPVHRSTMGPVVEPVSLADAIGRALDRAHPTVPDEAELDRARAAFTPRAAFTRALELLGGTGGEPVPLEKSSHQRHLDARRARFGGGRRIFEGYEDPATRVFFEAYGMKEPLTFDKHASYVLTPWVSCSDGVLRVDDPHRGRRRFRVDAGIAEPVAVTACPPTDTWHLPASLVESLVTQGYAFVLPPTRGAPGMPGTHGKGP